MKNTFSHIVLKLAELNVGYRLLEHRPVHTTLEAETVVGHQASEGTKSLALTDTQKLFVVSVSGDESVNFKGIATVVGSKRLSMAKPGVMEATLGCEGGALSPFGYSDDVTLVVSRRLFDLAEVYMNPGRRDMTMVLHGSDFARIMASYQALVI